MGLFGKREAWRDEAEDYQWQHHRGRMDLPHDPSLRAVEQEVRAAMNRWPAAGGGRERGEDSRYLQESTDFYRMQGRGDSADPYNDRRLREEWEGEAGL